MQFRVFGIEHNATMCLNLTTGCPIHINIVYGCVESRSVSRVFVARTHQPTWLLTTPKDYKGSRFVCGFMVKWMNQPSYVYVVAFISISYFRQISFSGEGSSIGAVIRVAYRQTRRLADAGVSHPCHRYTHTLGLVHLIRLHYTCRSNVF